MPVGAGGLRDDLQGPRLRRDHDRVAVSRAHAPAARTLRPGGRRREDRDPIAVDDVEVGRPRRSVSLSMAGKSS